MLLLPPTLTRRAVVLWFLSGAMIFACVGASDASPILVDVLSMTYTTSLATNADAQFRTQTSDAPIRDSLLVDGVVWAAGMADFLSVSVEGHAESPTVRDSHSTATAETDLVFSILTDVSTTLALDFIGDFEFRFSDALVRLFDITADEELWSYGWTCCFFRGNVPWDPGAGSGTAGVTVGIPTNFLASHVYALRLYSLIGSNNDQELLRIDVSGLKPRPVPEPSTFVLLATGILALGRRRWWVRKLPRSIDSWK